MSKRIGKTTSFDAQVNAFMALGHTRQSAIEEVQFMLCGGDLREVGPDGVERPAQGRSIFDDELTAESRLIGISQVVAQA